MTPAGGTIVNVLCAYLRMPYTLPDAHLPEDADDTARDVQEQRVQEREVRLTAQRILSTRLYPGRNPDHPHETFWANMNLDLTGATLIDFHPIGCRINIGRFDGATFTGTTRFDDATFTGHAWFEHATFTGEAHYPDATFNGRAMFSHATFTGDVWFNRVTFTGTAWFSRATFAEGAFYIDTTFAGDALFNATFTATTNFDGATFHVLVPPNIRRFMGRPPQDSNT